MFLRPSTGQFHRDPLFPQPASGLWSHGQTMWVADYAAGKAFAYRLSDGVRVAGREFDLVGRGGVPTSPFGLWSDAETMLVTVARQR